MNLTGNLWFQSMLFVLQNGQQDGQQVNKSQTEKCYGSYGCYSIDYPWISDSRPVSYFPKAPEELNIRFPTFTRNNIKIPYFLDPRDPRKIKSGKFQRDAPFFIIAHGYLEGGDKPWIERMTTKLLALKENENATIVAIDWRGGSGPPYSQAVANTRLIGVMTAHLIHDLFVHLNLKHLDNFHFIGHSLGAHLGGYAGATLRMKFNIILGRITGLDPAEPFFGKVENMIRLDRTDARFVDVIHTDASPFISGGLGLAESIGHVDFFPNGGANQPGCSQGMMQYINAHESLFKGIRKFIGCNHLRSHEYFIESITTSCPFLAISCSSYQDFARGSCFQCGAPGQECLRFGYYSYNGYKRLLANNLATAQASTSVYFMTGDMDPFCRLHYRVTVNISSSVESVSHGGDIGRLWMVLVTKNGTLSEKIHLEEHAGFHKPGTQKTIMVATKELGIPESVQIEWEYETNILNPFTWRMLMSPKIYISWVYVESLEYKIKFAVCPVNDSPVLANTPSHFKQHNCRNILPLKISTTSTFAY